MRMSLRNWELCMFAWIDWEYMSGKSVKNRTKDILCLHRIPASLGWLCFLHKWHNIIAILSTIHGAAGRLCINHTKWQADTMHKAMVPSFASIKLLHVRARVRIYIISFRFIFILLLLGVAPFCESEWYKSSGNYGHDWKLLFIRLFFFYSIKIKVDPFSCDNMNWRAMSPFFCVGLSILR